jgi:hypothetical protein
MLGAKAAAILMGTFLTLFTLLFVRLARVSLTLLGNPMNYKLLMAVVPVAVVPTIAYAQKDVPATEAPKPTTAIAQKLVETIKSDTTKLKVYYDMGRLQEQIERAEQDKDNRALEALSAQADSLLRQMGPEYATMIAGLDDVDPDSEEGKRFAAVFEPLDKQCK